MTFNDSQLIDFNVSDNDDKGNSSVLDFFLYENENSLARYFYWPDIVHGGFTFTDIALRVTEDDKCTMTLVAKQTSKFYTHPRNNRSVWTGPHLSLVLLDRGRVPVGEIIQLGQINRICEQSDTRLIKTINISGAFILVKTGTFTASSYRLWKC